MKLLVSGTLTLALAVGLAVVLGPFQAAGADDNLRTEAAAYVDGHLAGKDPGTQRTIFTYGNFDTGAGWVRNPKLWCADLDLTCFSHWNSTEHNLQAGTLITRRHILLANHFSNPYTGTPPMIPGITTIEFVGRDNVTQTRTVARLAEVKGTDILIGTLNKDLPDTVTPVQLFPADKGHAVPPGTPVIYTGQEKFALVGECVSGSGPVFMLRPATVAGRVPWSGGLARVGDSGSPVFIPWKGRAVLLGHFHFPNGGPITGYYTAAINAITGPDYPVTEADLSAREPPAKPARSEAGR